MRFSALIEQGGKTATGIQVPDEVVTSLGSSKKPAIRVTLRGYTYRTTVAVMGGRFLIPVSAEIRANAGVAGGDQVDVEIEVDTEPREVSVPPDFTQALEGDEKARQFFDGLSYCNKRRLVLSIDGAKAAETRQRRIEKTVSALREGRV